MIKKIYTITILSFLILIALTITNINKKSVLRTNYEIEKVTNIKNNTVYLLDSNDYFVEVDIFFNKGTQKEIIEQIINYLKVTNDNTESNFKGYIPANTKINDIQIINSTAYLDFSKDLIKNDNTPIKGIVKTILKLNNIDKVSIKVEGKYIDGFENELEDISINEQKLFTNRKDISKVVVYYDENINGKNYSVPVTKYLNDSNEKIEIIVEELKNNIPDNLIGYPNINTDLLDAKEENNTLILDFNEYILEEKESYNQISKSVFANYDVSSVVFKVNNKIENIVTKAD